MKLLNTQKLSVLKLADESQIGVDKIEFGNFVTSKYDGESNAPSTSIKIKESGFSFNVTMTHGYLNYEYTPKELKGLMKNQNNWIKAEHYDWTNLLSIIGDWMKLVKEEIAADQEIAMLLSQAKNIPFDNVNNANESFSKEEIALLEHKVFQFSTYLATIPLPPKQLEEILTTVNYLKEKANESSKNDWRNLFIGTIISIIIQLSVTQENAKFIWDGIKTILFNGHLLP